MSGHSKWSTIKRQKGATDIKRGLTFTKIANAITIAARSGGSGNPDSNPRLRASLESARKVNMPKENVARAIDRGLGKLPGQTLEEVYYEGFGPSKVAFYLEGVTDNRLRTSQEVKNLFERAGGNLGSIGSTAYLFTKVGEIRVKGKGGGVDEEMLELIDLGAEDVEPFGDAQDRIDGVQKYLIYIETSKLNQVSNNVIQSGFAVEEAGIVMKPNLIVEITAKEEAERVLSLAEKLGELDDIQKVYANFDIKEGLFR